MLDRKPQRTEAPEEGNLHQNIAVLSGEVARLEDEKNERLEFLSQSSDIQNRITDAKNLLESLHGEIEGKQRLLKDASTDYDTMFGKLTVLKQEYAELEKKVIERRELVSDIEKLRNDFRIAQKNLADLHDTTAVKKREHQSTILKGQESIKNLHSMLGEVITKFQQ